MTSQISSFLDQAPLAAAEENFQAATLRLASARTNIEAARVFHAAAEADADAAEAGQIELDPLAADEVLAAAERRLAVCSRVLEKAEASVQDANANRHVAQGEAHKPVYIEGIQRRLKAADKADRARALLAEATADHTEATEFLNYASRAGTPHIVHDQGHNHPLGTLAEETKLWAPANGWWAGLPITA